MFDNMGSQKRILIAIVISFVILIGYDYFFAPKKELNQNKNQTSTNLQKNTSLNNKQELNSNKALQIGTSAPNTQDIKTPLTSSSMLVEVKSDKFTAYIDNLGRIESFYLDEKRFTSNDGKHTSLFASSNNPKPLEIRFSNSKINKDAFNTNYTTDTKEINITNEPKSIVLTQKLSELTIEKHITFYRNGNYDVNISLSKPTQYFLSTGYRPSVNVDKLTFHGALILKEDNTIETIKDGDVDENMNFQDSSVASASDRYYTTALYNFNNPFDVVISPNSSEDPNIFIKSDKNLELKGYIGAKDYDTLLHLDKDKRLTKIIEYGFLTFLAKPVFLLLRLFYNVFHNWGWAIVFTTILIRVVLFPLTYKGMISMNKIKELAPKVKDLREKYKGDSKKLNLHMMELYKKHKANPMSGCFPIVIQIPIFFAIYRVLLNAIELKGASWIFWIHDLSVKDPFYVLPILMGVSMFLQQRITPMSVANPTQEKIMRFLPVIFTFFFATFPAGLTLYWFTSNIFSFGQQFYANKIFERNKRKLKKANA